MSVIVVSDIAPFFDGAAFGVNNAVLIEIEVHRVGLALNRILWDNGSIRRGIVDVDLAMLLGIGGLLAKLGDILAADFRDVHRGDAGKDFGRGGGDGVVCEIESNVKYYKLNL